MSVLPDGYIDEGPDLDMELVFFPTEVAENISPICEGICLGSIGGTSDRNRLKKHNITHILTVASNCVPDPHFEDIKYELFDLPDCPTYMIYNVFKQGLDFMRQAIISRGTVFVHCGRGVSRSASLVIAYLMHYEGKMFQEALTLVNKQRQCAYPNIGFQLQLQYFEKSKSFDCSSFQLCAEIVITIQRKLNDVDKLVESIMEDFSLLEDTEPWHHLGYFFENCRQYLCRADAGIPPALVTYADNLARRVQNLCMLFEGDGSEIAAKVGEVIANWVKAHKILLTYPDRPLPPPFALDYKSLVWATGVNNTSQVEGAAQYSKEQAVAYAELNARAAAAIAGSSAENGREKRERDDNDELAKASTKQVKR